jgi:hypothetical protein
VTQDKYDFGEQDKEGKAAEEMYKKYLMKEGWTCRKTKGKNPDEPYDYEITDGCWGDRKTIEIKSYGKPELGTIFAETVQLSDKYKEKSIPEYLTYPHMIDEMIYVDQKGKRAFVYDMKKFAKFVESIKYLEQYNTTHTAKGVKITEDSSMIGYIKTINI